MKTEIEWIKCIDKFPEPFQTVLVAGGLAFHTGTTWHTVTYTDWPGKAIQWPVLYWANLPQPPNE